MFTKLFGDFLVFVYHCFDRIVIRGYLTALSRPELVVHFFREIVGVAEADRDSVHPAAHISNAQDAACAAPSPTAASITGRTRNTVQTAGSKPPITAPTPPSNASSISWGCDSTRCGVSFVGGDLGGRS